jgi:hypothetical protein
MSEYAYVYEHVGYNKGFLKNASDRLKDDEDIVKKAVLNDSGAFEYASDRLKDDKDFVKWVITASGSIKNILNFASERVRNELKDDKNALMAALKSNWYPSKTVLQYASDRLRDDKDFVLEQVGSNGDVLEYASNRLKDDEEVVLAAILSDLSALKYASDRLKDDKEFFLSLVKINYYTLKYASDRLRSDINFCIECAKIDKKSISSFPDEIKILFETHKNDFKTLQEVYAQQQANERLLDKLSTGEITVHNQLFKRKLFNI